MPIYKEYRVDRPFPDPESILFEELGSIIQYNLQMVSTFREKFMLNPIQEEIVRHYMSAEDDLQIYLLYGGRGSGKTTTALGLGTSILLDHPGATGLGVRKTYTDLEDTLMPAVENFWNRYDIKYKTRIKPAPTYTLYNTSKFMLRSESRAVQSRQEKADTFGSTEYSFVFFEEADSISKMFFLSTIGSMRQRKICVKPLIIMCCNPPPEDHWLYEYFFIEHNPNDQDSNVKAFWIPIKDNIKHIGVKEYEAMVEHYKAYPSLYRKFVEGKFGPLIKGNPIFGGIFNRDLHVSKTPLDWDMSQPMCRGWDFGFRRPAVVVFQDDIERNEIRVLKAYLGRYTLLRPFAQMILRFCDKYYPGAKWEDYCDAAGIQRKDDGRTSVEVLRGLGLRPKYEKTQVQYGLDIIQQNLTELSSLGRPIIQLDPYGAKHLIDAFEKGYTYDPDTRMGVKVKPFKDGFYDHLMDAFRYGIIQKRRFHDRAHRYQKSQKSQIWSPARRVVGPRKYRAEDLSKVIPFSDTDRPSSATYNFGRSAYDDYNN